jgi:hypothetical protein
MFRKWRADMIVVLRASGQMQHSGYSVSPVNLVSNIPLFLIEFFNFTLAYPALHPAIKSVVIVLINTRELFLSLSDKSLATVRTVPSGLAARNSASCPSGCWFICLIILN